MELNVNTKIDDLLKEYPFLMEFLVARSPKFRLLCKPCRQHPNRRQDKAPRPLAAHNPCARPVCSNLRPCDTSRAPL